ncbi:glutathione S-transferase family protein [Sphingomonas sp. TZW2008]|uniref:glutathione S-transferase family protein n=1 Tax=Sphingomonas sp. TZW2008 TaxID=1917973 RepID=UPI000A2713FB|nr:glutathione S-transferase family protein [Sphingomonas sp. TZW2008]
MTEYVLHEDPASGNCYKIRLVAAHLGIPLQRRRYDIRRGETRTPAFLAEVDAGGRIPVLQIGARFLPESNAACAYLASGSALIPSDRFDHADMLRWLFWEQYSHEPNIATLRFWRRYLGEASLAPAQTALIPGKQAAGEAALALMARHLETRDWLAAGTLTLADLVLYAYTHLAGEGGFDLAAYPAVERWLARVAAMPGHIRFDD